MHDPIPRTEPVAAQPPLEPVRIRLGKRKKKAAGAQAVIQSFKHVLEQSGVARGPKLMTRLNQKDGFDCPSCAWPDPDGHRSSFEFCENGAKALASETTLVRANRRFFRKHSVAELSRQSDHWLERAGRLTEPMLLREGATHYVPVTWDEAFRIIGERLRALPGPDAASFYTSGRASNEAAFLWALFARRFGTNNLPDCSNMCHESSGFALGASIGIGKGTVSLADLEEAETILCVGQNPGTNHPRMLTTLQSAVRNGAVIVAVNPLIEAGLKGFAHPQEPVGMLGIATSLAAEYLQVRIGGDQALFKGLAKALLQAERERPGTVLDEVFLREHTTGAAEYLAHLETLEWPDLERRSGIARTEMERIAARCAARRKLITCWAMGLTQQPHAVATIQEVANFHFLLGAIGRPGAGLCPVRGHSNVQGDRTMGVFHLMPESYSDALQARYGFNPPRHEGHDVVHTIHAMHQGRVKVFIGLGGNFLQASPDTEFTASALRACDLTVQVSTKLNRSHLVTGKTALILPCLGRSERDLQGPPGQRRPQFVTVENSMGVVHQSTGRERPASRHLRSECAIVAGIAEAALGPESGIPWRAWTEDYERIRDEIEAIIPGFEDFNRRVRQPGGFYLPNGAKQRRFETASGKAEFHVHALADIAAPPGQLILQTLRSHDQFNTTIYGMNDRYRGIGNQRRIVFLNPEDLRERGLKPLQPVDLTSHWNGRTRQVKRFLAIPYDQPRGMAAAYYPEANPLVPIDSVAAVSNTPTSKCVFITVAPSEGAG
jgi:molybdopterin-dependent oxidoreductase alpha subunit